MARLEFSDGEFNNVLRKAQELYPTIGQVNCPYFRDVVHFNAQGLEHIRGRGWNRGRRRQDQFMRLKFLAQAPEVLRLSRTVQGVLETHGWERRHRYGRWEQFFVPVTYYEFIAVLGKRRFRVIVKKLASGQRIFWSLIPFWRQDEQGRRLIHAGSPATD